MLTKAYQTIKKYNMVQKDDCIIVGISGGADSVTLFHFLCTIKSEYNLKLIAVHVHHGLRGEDADRDAQYVEQLCSDYNITFELFKYDIHKEAELLNITEEEAGRIKRYEAFQKTLTKYKANKIAVAHNMNDQAETLLMRICRGTGIKGLCGILPIRDNIIRPLIECERKSIEQYCIENNLLYKNDYTNDMDIYTRNKIRLQLIPWIEQKLNPSIVQTLSNMASSISQEEMYMQKQADEIYKLCSVIVDKILKIDLTKLIDYHIVIQKRVLRIALQYFKKDLHDIEAEHISKIIELMNKETGKKINITNNIVVEKQYNYLCFYTGKAYESNIQYCYDLKFNDKIYIKESKIYINSYIISKENFKQNPNNLYTKTFDYDKIGGDIKVRTRLAGDKIYLKSVGNKKLKDLFIDMKIPRDIRNTIPLLAVNNNIIWVLGYRVSNAYNIDKATKKIIYIEYKIQED